MDLTCGQLSPKSVHVQFVVFTPSGESKGFVFVCVRVRRSTGQFNNISGDMTWVTECFTIKQGGVWANIVQQTVSLLGVLSWNQNQHFVS